MVHCGAQSVYILCHFLFFKHWESHEKKKRKEAFIFKGYESMVGVPNKAHE